MLDRALIRDLEWAIMIATLLIRKDSSNDFLLL